MSKRIAIAVATGVFALPLVAYLTRTDAPKPVEVAVVRPRVLTPVILASGSLVYENQVTLVPELLAKVKEMHVAEGDHVKPGDLLMRLDSEAIRAELSRLDSSKRSALLETDRRLGNARQMQIQWARYAELNREGMIPISKFEDAGIQKANADLDVQSGREAARQVDFQIREAQQQLSQTEIRSPIEGQVVSVGIKGGETAIPSSGGIPGSTLAVIAQTTGMLAEVNVDEADIERVQLGQHARIVPAGSGSSPIDATVLRIAMMSHAINGQGRTFSVKLRIASDQATGLRAGTTCRAELLTGGAASPQLAIPLQALRYDEAQKDVAGQHAHVFVAEHDRVSSRAVDLGISDDSHVQITRGLRENETVVTGSYKTMRFLRDGDKVVASPRNTPGSDVHAEASR